MDSICIESVETIRNAHMNLDTRLEPHPFDEKDFYSLNPVIKEIIRTGIEILV